MGKGRNPKGKLSREDLNELSQQLGSGQLSTDLDDGVCSALAQFLGAAEQVDQLVTLYALASNKQQRKAVNQALYRLKRLGLPVPDVKQRPPAIELVPPIEPEDLPVLMCRPDLNGERLFFLPHRVGHRYLTVHAGLRQDHGLAILNHRDSTRSDYRNLIMGLTLMRDHIPPDWRLANQDLKHRKLWEIGQLIRRGRTSDLVDHETSLLFRWPKEAPPHPLQSLDLEDVEPRTTKQLLDDPELTRGFIAPATFAKLEERLVASDESPIILSDAQVENRHFELVASTVQEIVDLWSLDDLAEVIRDSAYYQALGGNKAVARGLRAIVEAESGPEVERSVRKFMSDLLIHKYSLGSPSSGLILP